MNRNMSLQGHSRQPHPARLILVAESIWLVLLGGVFGATVAVGLLSAGLLAFRTPVRVMPVLLVVLLALLVITGVVGLFRTRREWTDMIVRHRGPSACAGCGYDLRGTPQRCPECGLAPANTRAAA